MFYIILLTFAFVLLPFAYFFYEELGDFQRDDYSLRAHCCTAFKYTVAFIVILAILLVIGVFVNTEPVGSDHSFIVCMLCVCVCAVCVEN